MRKVAVGALVIICILAISVVPLAASVKITDEFKLDGTFTLSYDSDRGYVREFVAFGVPPGIQLLGTVKSGDWTLEWGNTNRGYLTYTGSDLGEFQVFNNELMSLQMLWRTLVPRQVGAQFEHENLLLRVSNTPTDPTNISYMIQPSYEFGATKVTGTYIIDGEDDINAWCVRLDHDLGNIDFRGEYGQDDSERDGYMGRVDWDPEGPADFYTYYYDDIRANTRWRTDFAWYFSPKCYSSLGADIRGGREDSYYARLNFNL